MASRREVQPTTESLPGWVVAIVIVGAVLMALGGVIALVKPEMLVSPTDSINGAVKVYAGYLVSRNLALALMLVAALGLRDRRVLTALMVLVGLIQLFDTVMDAVEGRWPLVPGVLVFAIVYFVGARRISGGFFWPSGARPEDR